LAKQYTSNLNPGDYHFVGDELRMRADIYPLHPNHALLYETILQLAPRSVCEIGCGGGDHLHNLGVLAPGTVVAGLDRSEQQLSFATERHPELSTALWLRDVSQAAQVPTSFLADVAFTQAVLMHIRDRNAYLRALKALFQIARNQVLMVENWSFHEFVQDVRQLRAAANLPWSEVYLYYRAATKGGAASIMIASRTTLGYPELTDQCQLILPATARDAAAR
jgi:trans-aconitate methyltransferase